MSHLPTRTRALSQPLQRARYRVSQFWRGFNARVSEDERTLAVRILPPDAKALFDRMPVDAQRHSFDVLHAVQSMSIDDADLDAAALLHDVGKLASSQGGIRLGLWLRGPLVLLEAWSPGTLNRVASVDPRTGWRYTAYVHLEHPRIGAQWAANAGCSDLTCWLIRHHQDDIVDLAASDVNAYDQHLLAMLQAADGNS